MEKRKSNDVRPDYFLSFGSVGEVGAHKRVQRVSSLQRFSGSIIVVLLPCAYMAIVAPLHTRDEPSHFLETFVRGLRLQFDVSLDRSARNIRRMC